MDPQFAPTNKIFRYASKDRFDRLLDSRVPAYGHGQVLDYPDLPFLRWSYEYDYSDEFSEGYRSTGIIENRERYRRAFLKLKEYLSDYSTGTPSTGITSFPLRILAYYFMPSQARIPIKGGLRAGLKAW